ncbi:MAG: RNA pseudouridine synthase [Saprospiraceae bacterium]|nr:RNA pseudouridine synthase [Saprospiraceae bacterium]
MLQNQSVFVFNKPPGIPVQANSGIDFHHMVNAYAKRPLFLVHRIDQPASGVVLVARNAKAAAAFSEQFVAGTVSRIYYAVVSQRPDDDEGDLVHHLVHDKKVNKTRLSNDQDDQAKRCELHYKYAGSSDTYHLLEIQLQTGRHHQIRAQLAAAGMVIKGDVKYGARRSNKDRSIHLHGASLTIQHPVTHETITIEAPWPDEVLWNYFRSQRQITPV